jgi:hypothetical protein
MVLLYERFYAWKDTRGFSIVMLNEKWKANI